MKKHALFLFALSCLPEMGRGQPDASRELTGRVVEIRDGQTVGVSKITVSIIDFAYDVTDANGLFKIPLPPDRDHVSIVLENTASRMVSPWAGVVNLPPDEGFQIVVCGQENNRLSEKVSALSGRINKLEKEKKLSARQLQAMHEALLDTILHFEKMIGGLHLKLQKSEENNAALSAELALRDARIQALEDSVGLLVNALGKALEEKYLRQKQHFDEISAELLAYADRLKDLRDRSTPSQLPYPFVNPRANELLSEDISQYNEARQSVVKNHHAQTLAVQRYWEDPKVANQLDATWQYLLKSVHDEWVLPLDERVFGQIRSYAARQVGRGKAQKKAEKAAEEILPGLNAAIVLLQEKIQNTIQLMATNI